MSLRIAVLGLGPVGLATSWDLLRRGHEVHGFDRNAELVQKLRNGDFKGAPDFAADLCGEFKARFHIHENSEWKTGFSVAVLCVGTPFHESGFDLSGLLAACKQAAQLAVGHVIFRSTLEPGSLQNEILPSLPKGMDVSYYPEFLREKFAKEDLLNPPLGVAAHGSDSAQNRFRELFPHVQYHGNRFADLEAVKIVSNAFHALKVVFANEVSSLCSAVGADPSEVMDLFCQDEKLNLSSKYLRPGPAFQGNCLDKDLRALEKTMERLSVPGEVLKSIRLSNDRHRS